MKNYFIIWFNYTTEYFIKEDWNILNKFGKILIFPFWIIRSLIVYILSFIFSPIIIWLFEARFNPTVNHSTTELNDRIQKDIFKLSEKFLGFK